MHQRYDVIVIGGGHAGVEAAWAAANILARPCCVALVTQSPSTIGVMSCNPAIGGLAKGQIVREIDAMGGLMALASDATGIQFKVLNTSKGPAVHGPRAQCDKHAYARCVQGMIAARAEIVVIAGSVEGIVTDRGAVTGVRVKNAQSSNPQSSDQDRAETCCEAVDCELFAPAVVLTTGTFMRGLMHTGEEQTPGGRFGEAPATGISAALVALGFELGRLKTGTPPRLRRGSIAWESLPAQTGDAAPVPFSDLSGAMGLGAGGRDTPSLALRAPCPSIERFPVRPQVECRITTTNAEIHEHIRANLHRAPMYSGQIDSAGPRYCPSLEDKVVRFAQRDEHQVFLEPESLGDDWVYCNGISTSLPADVQDFIVRRLPGCERAQILRYGYAVEYDMVRPHQLRATGETKLVPGLYLAGQINGTSGYEEAAGQGLIAGINAARRALGHDPVTLGRDESYIGVMMDDLVTKTPVEPYRMFTSRAEHRLLLRAGNSADRLTPIAQRWGMLDHSELGRLRTERFARRRAQIDELHARIAITRMSPGRPLSEVMRRPDFTPATLIEALVLEPGRYDPRVLEAVCTEHFYSAYIAKERAQIERSLDAERRSIPDDFDYERAGHLRTEAREALRRFRPGTLGQASRLEGMTPADVTLLGVLIGRHRRAGADR